MRIDDDDDAAAAAAVATIRTAIRHVLFAQKAAGAGAAVTGPRHDAYAINKHVLRTAVYSPRSGANVLQFA